MAVPTSRWTFPRSTMILIICFLTTVSSQVSVNTSRGKDVLIPCSHSQADTSMKDLSVFWRTRDEENVYDILQGNPDLSTQATQFKDRITSFPKWYTVGNFSLVLQKSQLTDSGVYKCFIPKLDVEQHVTLTVADNPVESEKEEKPVGPEKKVEQDVHTGDGSVALTFNLLGVNLLLLLGQTLLPL
ncbi:CD276 antigen homolog isoform X2 [Lampris incognitus]|uniref:CD276 antigen homolog isoform X2 n=2 Tax=Lampris incognitus TaxID=2546036 RepID=UPI0024B520EE|nr:CD276 antigen homolog isoform X2 [Lampris incognitus]